MSDHAHGMDGRVLRPDAASVERIAKFDCVHTARSAIEDDDVALDGGGINSQSVDLCDALCEALGVRVIFV